MEWFIIALGALCLPFIVFQVLKIVALLRLPIAKLPPEERRSLRDELWKDASCGTALTSIASIAFIFQFAARIHDAKWLVASADLCIAVALMLMTAMVIVSRRMITRIDSQK